MTTQKETFVINCITYFGNENYAQTLFEDFLADDSADQEMTFDEWLEMEDNYEADQFKAE